MIPGFIHTQPLTSYELETLMPAVVNLLAGCIGKANTICNSRICNKLKVKGLKVNDISVRKIINHIRLNGLLNCLVASGNGYYIATSKIEVEEYLKTLENREGAINAVRKSLETQLLILC